ncbi:MAG: MFS transporter [Actinomycetes bacterium]
MDRPTDHEADLAAVQRRTVRVLAAAQVLGGVGVGSGIAIGGLIAEDVSGSTALSGLAQTATVLGAAVAALPMARLMASRGRRPGLVAGYAVALVGAVVVILGAVVEVFALVLLGSVLLGCGTATNLQSRYAAADLAEAGHRARALATVVWATTIGVVLGPNLTGPGGALAEALGLPVLSGPLLFSIAAFAVAAVVAEAALRPDPLLLSRRSRGDGAHESGRSPSFAESMAAVTASRAATLALAAVALAHTVMVSVMVMTPVHMRHEGATLDVVGLVISAHVAGMYALSPVAGLLSDRLGRVPVIVLGQLLLVAAVAVSGGVPGHAHAALGVGLTLLGLGWSCALVAGSTLLSESVGDRVRPGVQGAADFVMGACGAAGGALAGVVVAGPGYGVLNALAGVLVCPVLALVLGLRRSPALPR